MKSILILLLAISLPGKALDIDEKLTLRLLKLSSSKRTILINRGVEDGLAVGDHAKFYLSTGMVARGVVVKTSPARSIWSLYRIITPSKLRENHVLNLKIATPVKITPDPSKAIMVEPLATPGKDIPLSPDINFLKSAAESMVTDTSLESLDEQRERQKSEQKKAKKDVERVFKKGLPNQKSERTTPSQTEITGSINLNHLGGKIKSNTEETMNTEMANTLNFSVGIERYLYFLKSWDEKLSFQLFLHYGQNSIIDVDGVSLKNSFYGPSIGLSYSFFNHPKELKKSVGYANIGFGWGIASEQTKIQDNLQELNGDMISFHLGVGIKYLYDRRWGFKLQLDYHRRSERYQLELSNEDDSSIRQDERKKTLSGPRLQVGFIYRI